MGHHLLFRRLSVFSQKSGQGNTQQITHWLQHHWLYQGTDWELLHIHWSCARRNFKFLFLKFLLIFENVLLFFTTFSNKSENKEGLLCSALCFWCMALLGLAWALQWQEIKKALTALLKLRRVWEGSRKSAKASSSWVPSQSYDLGSMRRGPCHLHDDYTMLILRPASSLH
jgi:hypothetical protein